MKEKIRNDFPVLQKVTYMDSACMSLKPRQVVEAMDDYYLNYPACAGRSAHRLGKTTTENFENARKRIAKFICARPEEIIFTRNTTEGLNFAASVIRESGKVITTDKEHNSNFLPWRRFDHKIISTKNGLDIEALEKEAEGADAISVASASNIDGSVIDIEKISRIARDAGALMVVDGAQSVPHMETDVRKIGCDMMAFSGHKMLGPSIGCLYIKKDISEKITPFMPGGGTVENIIDGNPVFAKPPHLFEGGLQDYAGAIGLGEAVRYIESVGIKTIERHEAALNKIITDALARIENISMVGSGSGITSFNIEGIAPAEAAIMFDSYNVMLRGGMHCCHNWFNSRDMEGSIRSSLYLYNDERDAEIFSHAAGKIARMV